MYVFTSTEDLIEDLDRKAAHADKMMMQTADFVEAHENRANKPSWIRENIEYNTRMRGGITYLRQEVVRYGAQAHTFRQAASMARGLVTAEVAS
jgi:hypothetical protein